MPDISPLQFLALGMLLGGEQSGRALRAEAKRFGVRRSRAAFYQFMARLERSGFVVGRYEVVEGGDQRVTERRYAITAAGRRAWHEARAFNEAVDRFAGGALGDV
jgi:DNA-binding PadR family transcriptional regulator